MDEGLIDAALARLDLEAKVGLLTGADFWKLNPAPAAGLRAIALSDGPCGAKGSTASLIETATGLPSPTAFAASWDEPLIREIAHLLAKESRDKGVDVLLAPMLNLQRSPLAGATSRLSPRIRSSSAGSASPTSVGSRSAASAHVPSTSSATTRRPSDATFPRRSASGPSMSCTWRRSSAWSARRGRGRRCPLTTGSTASR